MKNGFGVPKRVKGEQFSNIEIVDACIGTDKVYGLSSDGSFYEWDIFKGEEQDGEWLCKCTRILSNNHPILGFSSGDNYLLILGDIIKQIEYNESISKNLNMI